MVPPRENLSDVKQFSGPTLILRLLPWLLLTAVLIGLSVMPQRAAADGGGPPSPTPTFTLVPLPTFPLPTFPPLPSPTFFPLPTALQTSFLPTQPVFLPTQAPVESGRSLICLPFALLALLVAVFITIWFFRRGLLG